ncbi:O-antigen polysaccharide polymerase Wzy [Corynebacterium sp. H128]|uniref:O-antigen polysaccharide polymerase Wzy n=1 Tax=Corynebacterium sp. H128 TaxID=3133427 RepID=UPI00309AB948
MAVLTASLFLRKNGPSSLAFIAVYYLYFSFGPVIAYLLGEEIFEGTVEDHIPTATLGYAIAITGLWISDRIIKFSDEVENSSSIERIPFQKWSSWTFNTVLVSGIAYGIVFGLTVLSSGNFGNKGAAISSAGGFHYQYLLIMALSLCWTGSYWNERGLSRTLAAIGWLSFIFYCLITTERDFILILFSFGIHFVVFSKSRASVLKFGLMGALAAVLGTFLFVQRAGEELSFAAILNQGSTLFIDTFIYDWVESGSWYPTDSWVSALTNTLPTVDGALSQWLVVLYTGDNIAQYAYGFSITAEAFMNGGFFGILAFFCVIGTIHRLLLKMAQSSGVWLGLSVAFLYLFLYAIRGELYSFVSGSTGAILLAVFFAIGSRRHASNNKSTLQKSDSETLLAN